MHTTKLSLNPKAAFTLVEVLISMVITLMLVAALLTVFVSFSKSTLNITNYWIMETQKSLLLQTLAQDLRNASNISWGDASTFTLTHHAGQTTYSYDEKEAELTRTETGEQAQVLLTDIVDLTFVPYNNRGVMLSSNLSWSDLDQQTKMLQTIGHLHLVNTSTPVTNAHFTSARHMLRNKPTN
jgi:hypothetical protein